MHARIIKNILITAVLFFGTSSYGSILFCYGYTNGTIIVDGPDANFFLRKIPLDKDKMSGEILSKEYLVNEASDYKVSAMVGIFPGERMAVDLTWRGITLTSIGSHDTGVHINVGDSMNRKISVTVKCKVSEKDSANADY